MAVTKMNLLGFILLPLLWPSVITEILVPLVYKSPTATHQSVDTLIKKNKISTLSRGKTNFKTNAKFIFDKESFLLSFKRQANKNFVRCLRSSFVAGPVLLSATLTIQGKLRNIKRPTIGPVEPLPGCLLEETNKMNFKRLTKNLQQDSIELQWSLQVE